MSKSKMKELTIESYQSRISGRFETQAKHVKV